MIKPLGDRVVLQVEAEPEQSVGGIYIASNAQEKSVKGIVVAVSEQSIGELTAPQAVKVGDEVILISTLDQNFQLMVKIILFFTRKTLLPLFK
ncbi:co-chaperonin GroES [Weissella viridescens]|uniref:10 kDa chaperonin n=1 Tax=Weissella viridescens TaxID=1629 RepID=A0A380NZN9_WEIVI|nr:co-chaperonin GroES [Weissella viridescens]